MKRTLLPLVATFGLIAGLSFAEDSNAFAVDMYKQLSQAEKGNVFLSPHSITVAMAMVTGGAKGATQTETMRVMHFPADYQRVIQKQNAAFNANKDVTLNVANALCITGGGVSPKYMSLVRKTYQAEVFSGDVNKINGWVSKKTNRKIPKILEELNPNSVCVLLNAIYFKGNWAHQFEPKRTVLGEFHVSPSLTKKVSMMNQSTKFAMVEEQDYSVISLPYEGKSMDMVVVLPRAVDGLAKLEAGLSTDMIGRWFTGLNRTRPAKVMVMLPKFQLTTSYDLVKPLKSLGLQLPFSAGKADLSGIGSTPGEYFLGQIKHKAFVDVNEEGTEAAGTTAIEVVTQSASMPRFFQADHPFLFLIRDKRSNTILFIGRYSQP